jgi:hypothetical protein
VAVIGPAGVAFHTHHIVEAFHPTNVNVAQNAIDIASLHEPLYCALINNKGNKPTNKVMQLASSHGIDRSAIEATHKAAFVFFEN